VEGRCLLIITCCWIRLLRKYGTKDDVIPDAALILIRIAKTWRLYDEVSASKEMTKMPTDRMETRETT
jgi:hypothetical protein